MIESTDLKTDPKQRKGENSSVTILDKKSRGIRIKMELPQVRLRETLEEILIGKSKRFFSLESKQKPQTHTKKTKITSNE